MPLSDLRPAAGEAAAEGAGEELQQSCEGMNSVYCCRLQFSLLVCVWHHGLT